MACTQSSLEIDLYTATEIKKNTSTPTTTITPTTTYSATPTKKPPTSTYTPTNTTTSTYTPTVTPVPIGGGSGQIAYCQNNEGIYFINPDGAKNELVYKIYGNFYWKEPLQWSNDGIFLTTRVNISQQNLLRRYEVDGKQVDQREWWGWIVLSPDGNKYITYDDSYILGDFKNKFTYLHLTGRFVSWSPDSKKFIYSSYRNRSEDLYIYDTLTKEEIKFTKNGFMPDWSPDGEYIVFWGVEWNKPDNTQELFIVDLSGVGRTRLTFDDFQNWNPSWSPNGEKIAYQYAYVNSHSQGFLSDLYVIDLDTRKAIRLTKNMNIGSRKYSWSPDGTMIAFWGEPEHDENYGLYTVNVETGELSLLADGLDYCSGVAWRP